MTELVLAVTGLGRRVVADLGGDSRIAPVLARIADLPGGRRLVQVFQKYEKAYNSGVPVQMPVRPERGYPLVEPRRNGPALLAKFFRGLGDPTRVRILQLLLDGERTVGELVEELDSFQGRVSSHLACLRWCGFVTSRREGQNVYYQVVDSRVRKLLNAGADFLNEHRESIAFCRTLDPKFLPTPVGTRRRT